MQIWIERHTTPVSSAHRGRKNARAASQKGSIWSLVRILVQQIGTKLFALGRKFSKFRFRHAVAGKWRRLQREWLCRPTFFPRHIACGNGPFLRSKNRSSSHSVQDKEKPHLGNLRNRW